MNSPRMTAHSDHRRQLAAVGVLVASALIGAVVALLTSPVDAVDVALAVAFGFLAGYLCSVVQRGE